MKIIVTGSLGNISLPLTQHLLAAGHQVTVVSSSAGKKMAIENLGASAAIGSVEDAAFLTRTFTGADAAYCMIPLDVTQQDLPGYMRRVAQNYAQAIRSSGIRRVVVLSGWAAPVVPSENAENIFHDLSGVAITYLRPGSFYSNFLTSIDMIRGGGMMGAFMTLRYAGIGALLSGRRGLLMGNYGGDTRIAFVAPADIATAAAEELTTAHADTTIRYVASEVMTCAEAARIIGATVGKPWLQWIAMSDADMLRGMKMFGMSASAAATIVEMGIATRTGAVWTLYDQHKPILGKTKLQTFAEKEFAPAYFKKNK